MNLTDKCFKFFLASLLLAGSSYHSKCPVNCLKCKKDPQAYYNKLCVDCKQGSFLYSGTCYSCSDNCLECHSARKCRQCRTFFTLDDDSKCQFSRLQVVVKAAELLFALLAVFIGCMALRKYQIMKAEEKIAGEIMMVERNRRRRDCDVEGAQPNALLDSNGINFIEDVDEEGNVISKKGRSYAAV